MAKLREQNRGLERVRATLLRDGTSYADRDFYHRGRYFDALRPAHERRRDEYASDADAFLHLRAEFLARIEAMGLNAKSFRDHELRYEALQSR